tara:strand:+ start:7877 stop:8863 length:987 start_codon:yes stop_codon:yes gene_type:complete
MRKRSRTIETFSLSMVDLFACAMGAFMLLMIILTQYYQKTSRDFEEAQRNVFLLEQLRAQAESASRKAVEARIEAEKMARVNADEAEAMRQKANQAQAEARSAVASLEEAKKKANRQVKDLEVARRNAEERARSLERELEEAHRLAFLGIVTQAKKLIFVVDMSGSMKEYKTITEQAVAQMVDPMDSGYQMSMLGFHTDSTEATTPIFHVWPEPFPTLRTMNSSGISEAKATVRKWTSEFRGQTPTLTALKKALNSSAEAVILFTDGNPNDATHDEILSQITSQNAGRKEIHTVAVGDYTEDAEFVSFLFKLADRNGGQFVGLSSLGN